MGQNYLRSLLALGFQAFLIIVCVADVYKRQRQSAVAAAAYQSGEKLFCEYDQQEKHYPEKRGIVHNEILLPPNALSLIHI